MTLNVLLDKEYHKVKSDNFRLAKLYVDVLPKVAWRMTFEYNIDNGLAWVYAEKHLDNCFLKYESRKK